MKNNKGIDNKMKAKRLAAYALAASMVVTVAPIGAVQPVQVMAATTTATAMTVQVKNEITVGMTYADAIDKVLLVDKTEGASIGTVRSSKIAIYDGTTLLYSNVAFTTTPAITQDNTKAAEKFEVGKTYTIVAEFDKGTDYVWAAVGAGAIVVEDSDNATVSCLNGELEARGITLDFRTNTVSGVLDHNANAAGERWYRDGMGNKIKTTSIIQDKTDGVWYYVKDGVVTTNATGKAIVVSNDYGKWVVNNGSNSVSTGYKGIADGYYADGGKVQTDTTDIVSLNVGDMVDGAALVAATKYGVINGKVAKNTVIQETSTGDWYAVDDNGLINTAPTSPFFCKNDNGTWVIDNTTGKVDFTAEGIVIDNQRAVSSMVKMYYVKGGKIDYTKNGYVSDAQGIYYVKNGVVNTEATIGDASVVQNPTDGNWYAVDKNGVVRKSANKNAVSFAKNDYGTWLIHETTGAVMFGTEGLVKDANGDLSSDKDAIYYVKDGKVVSDKNAFFTQLAAIINGNTDTQVAIGKYCVENGKVAGKKASEAVVFDKETGNWFYVNEDGLNDIAYTDFAFNAYGTWFVNAGRVTFRETGVKVDTKNILGNGTGKEYFVENSKISSGYTGFSNGKYLENGVIKGKDVNNSVVFNSVDGNWYYVDAKGKADGSYTGLAANAYGIWNVVTGKVNFQSDGTKVVTANEGLIDGLTKGDTVYYKDGKVQSDFTGVAIISNIATYVEKGVIPAAGKSKATGIMLASDGNNYYVENGAVVASTGLKKTEDGIYYVNAGKVDKTKTAIVTDSGKKYYVVAGKVAEDVTDIVALGTTKYNIVKGMVTPCTIEKSIVAASDGTRYKVDGSGEVVTSAGLGGCVDGIFYVGSDGKVDTSKTDVVAAAANINSVDGSTVKIANGSSYYVENGQVKFNSNGIFEKSGAYHNIVNGVQNDELGTDNYVFVINSVSDATKQYVVKEASTTISLVSSGEGIAKIGTTGTAYAYVKDGAIVRGDAGTGIIEDKFATMWPGAGATATSGTLAATKYWYAIDGIVQSTFEGIVQDGTQKRYVYNGCVQAGSGAAATKTLGGSTYTIDQSGVITGVTTP